MKMKILRNFLIASALIFAAAGSVRAQGTYSTYYYQRTSLFEVLPVGPEDIVFVGNSITDGCEWRELFDNQHVKNRGISGDTTMGVYDRLGAILPGHPAKLFLMIGINDLSRGIAAQTVVENTRRILERIRKESPSTRVYLQSLLPVSDAYGLFAGHTARRGDIPVINEALKTMAPEFGATFVDLFSCFVDAETGKMDTAYSNDGLHLLGRGYLLWRDIVLPYVNEK